MSLPLKPLAIGPDTRKLDSREKKFHGNVEKALAHFESVTEWADYIASLGKLLKALQSWTPQKEEIRYYVPSPYQVSRRLASSLSPSLPSGVHQKTLEVYTYIFEKIGLDTLASECNIWIPGILPLMSYASMSVKAPLLDLYSKYLIQLPSDKLKVLIRALIASLFPGIDDESSEYQPMAIELLEDLKNKLQDDSLFWQTCYMVIATDEGRRLGGLVWLSKKFPSLNATIKKQQSSNENEQDASSEAHSLSSALQNLAPGSKDLIYPEPGLLIRCLVRCLDDKNDLLLKRAVLDLLIQQIHLDSPVIQMLITREDKSLLIMSCCKTALNRDMSLNRRIWNWLLGPADLSDMTKFTAENEANGSIEEQKDKDSTEYFRKYGLETLISGIKDLAVNEEHVTTAFMICLAIMDRWEIGSLVIPEIFIPLLLATQRFINNNTIYKAATSFFNAVETNIIWGKLFRYILDTSNLDLLNFVLSNFSVSNEEEILVRHLPLILLGILSMNEELLLKCDETSKTDHYKLGKQILDLIPERAFIPWKSVDHNINDICSTEEILPKISEFYDIALDPFKNQTEGAELSPPFTTVDITFLLIRCSHEDVISKIRAQRDITEASIIFIAIYEKIPEHSHVESNAQSDSFDAELIEAAFCLQDGSKLASHGLLGIVHIYTRYLFSVIPLLESTKLLKLIITSLWDWLLTSDKQVAAMKALEALERNTSPNFVAGALASRFNEEKDITRKVYIFDLLWNQLDVNTKLLDNSLDLLLQELFDERSPHYLYVSEWVSTVANSASVNRLFSKLTSSLVKFSFLERTKLQDIDDMDMFTYRVQLLSAVLNTSGDTMVKRFTTELTISLIEGVERREELVSYKNVTLSLLLKFLRIENNLNAKSIRSSLILLDTLLNGTEQNFKDIALTLLNLSSKYIADDEMESESIAVSLLNIVAKVLRLCHSNGIKLDIFDDNASHLKYIDYLVGSVSNMERPLIITSYINLLLGSIIYFENSIFKIILPLTNSIVTCVNKLFEKEKNQGGYYQSSALLLDGLGELLEIAHGYLMADEKDSLFASGSRTDFLQSVVSNVFSNDSATTIARLRGERDVVFQSFRQVVQCCLDIWVWAHGLSEVRFGNNTATVRNDISYKYKFKAKVLLERLFLLEPADILEDLISCRNDSLTIALVHVLDGNRPIMTVPHILHGVIHRCNKNSATKLSTEDTTAATKLSRPSRVTTYMTNRVTPNGLMRFLDSYIASLENAAIEEFYNDFMAFYKEVAANSGMYLEITSELLEMVSVISEKLNKSKFEEHKNIRKEIGETTSRYVASALTEIDIEDTEVILKLLPALVLFVSKLHYIVNDEIGSDRFNSILLVISTNCLTPFLRIKNSLPVTDNVLELIHSVTKVGYRLKAWRVLLNDYFQDDKKFESIGTNSKWQAILGEWAQYPENKSKIMTDLLGTIDSKGTAITPALITFNAWNVSEIESKCKSLQRISYLLMIAKPNAYLLQFHVLIGCFCQYVESKNSKLKSVCWVLLRAMLIKFSPTHFNDFWSVLVYSLQTSFQEFYEMIQIQKDYDSNLVLHMSKTLDLLLALNLEEFTSTNQWIFIIDTIDCIYKENSFVSVVDEISGTKAFAGSKIESIPINDQDLARKSFLNGTHRINSYMQLNEFFKKLSYLHYEATYSLKELDRESCEADIVQDIFA